MPRYPEDLLERGEEGRTLLRLRIDPDGSVIGASVVSATHLAFAQAAVESAKGWTFEPGTVDGIAAPQTVLVPVRFRIEGNTHR